MHSRSSLSLTPISIQGTVTAAELVTVYKECGVNITEAEALEIIKPLDINGDNKVDFAEFLKVAATRLVVGASCDQCRIRLLVGTAAVAGAVSCA
jgi:Ca2+-binding EF-hand superfamily protein